MAAIALEPFAVVVVAVAAVIDDVVAVVVVAADYCWTFYWFATVLLARDPSGPC